MKWDGKESIDTPKYVLTNTKLPLTRKFVRTTCVVVVVVRQHCDVMCRLARYASPAGGSSPQDPHCRMTVCHSLTFCTRLDSTRLGLGWHCLPARAPANFGPSSGGIVQIDKASQQREGRR